MPQEKDEGVAMAARELREVMAERVPGLDAVIEIEVEVELPAALLEVSQPFADSIDLLPGLSARCGGGSPLQEREDLRALLRAQVRLLVCLHLVEHRRPVGPVPGFVSAMARGAFRPVHALLLAERTRRRGAAGECEDQEWEGARDHRFKPITERRKVPPAVSPTPNPAPTCSHSLLVANEIDGPA